MKRILPFEILALHNDSCRLDGISSCGFCKNLKSTDNCSGRNKSPRVKLCLRYTHHIPGFVYRNFYMSRVCFILDPAVRIVTHHCHMFGGFCHIRKAGKIIVLIRLKILFEFLIIHQIRKERHHNGSTVSSG